MPKAYSEDSRLRAVWLHYFLGHDIEETAGLLAMSIRSVERYLRKYVRTGEVIITRSPLSYNASKILDTNMHI